MFSGCLKREELNDNQSSSSSSLVAEAELVDAPVQHGEIRILSSYSCSDHGTSAWDCCDRSEV